MPAHEAVGHVPVSHVLPVLHGDDVAQHARIQHALERHPEGRIAQHVADLERAPGALRSLDQFHATGQRVGHGLLQQHVVARFHGSHGRLHVHLVLGGDDRALAHLPARGQFFPRLVAVRVVDVVLLGEEAAAHRVRFGHGHEANLFGMAQRVGRIRTHPAPACTDQDKFQRLRHDDSFVTSG